jgi:hypothetical protein
MNLRRDQVLLLFERSKRLVPFQWGINDCCLFAADWVYMLTGVDPAAKWRGEYSNALEAARLAADYGGVIGLVTAAGNWTAQEPTAARRGDLVLIPAPTFGSAVGVCAGSYLLIPGESGLLTVSMEQATNSWRID